MSEEELIETLRAFEKNRVEKLEEPARKLFYAIMKIADERDRLQAELDKTRLSELDKEYTIDSNINSYNKLSKYNSDLEDRIDKAIEYIKKHKEIGTSYKILDELEINELLNILKGSDKE